MSESVLRPTHIEYGSKSFTAILWSLFFAGFASFSSLYCVQPMMPIFAKFFQVSPTHSSFSIILFHHCPGHWPAVYRLYF